MTIIGVDIGCYTTYIACIRDGGVEILANEYSHLATPTSVSFHTNPRPTGYSSKQQAIAKFQSTCANFKPLLCSSIENHGPILDAIPCNVKAKTLNSDPNHLYASVQVMDNRNEKVTLAIQQVLAAFLTKIFTISRDATSTKVEECLLAVPYYWTDADRKVVMEAAQIAGFPFIKLINETAALTASYAFFKKATLPNAPEPPKKVVFVDVGYSQAQLILAEVHQQGAKVCHTQHSFEVGGFHFDNAIRNYFADEYKSKTKLDARSNRRAWLRLADEAERAKKSVCAASTKTIAAVECLMEDTDFKAEIDRAKFEDLVVNVSKAFEALVASFIAETKINPSEVEVELVGGSSRVPLIREIIEKQFGHEARTTMNQDEAICRGTALMAGLLSPRIRKIEFLLEDFSPFSVTENLANPEFVKQENEMRKADAYAILKAEAKNTLEGKYLDMQRNLEENPQFFDALKKENLSSFMSKVENFLYEDDADHKVEDYSGRLNELIKMYEDAKMPGLKIEEAPEKAEAMEEDGEMPGLKIEEAQKMNKQ